MLELLMLCSAILHHAPHAPTLILGFTSCRAGNDDQPVNDAVDDEGKGLLGIIGTYL